MSRKKITILISAIILIIAEVISYLGYISDTKRLTEALGKGNVTVSFSLE